MNLILQTQATTYNKMKSVESFGAKKRKSPLIYESKMINFSDLSFYPLSKNTIEGVHTQRYFSVRNWGREMLPCSPNAHCNRISSWRFYNLFVFIHFYLKSRILWFVCSPVSFPGLLSLWLLETHMSLKVKWMRKNKLTVACWLFLGE